MSFPHNKYLSFINKKNFIFFSGFSQGAIMGLAVALTQLEALGGVIALR